MKEIYCHNCGKLLVVSDKLWELARERKACCSEECAEAAGVDDPEKINIEEAV